MRHLCTNNRGSIEARVAWALLWAGTGGVLEEPAGMDYAGMLEGMEAQELLVLMEQMDVTLADGSLAIDLCPRCLFVNTALAQSEKNLK